MPILDETTRTYYQDQFLIRFAGDLHETQVDPSKINMLEFYENIVWQTVMDRVKSQLLTEKDVQAKNLPQILNNCVQLLA